MLIHSMVTLSKGHKRLSFALPPDEGGKADLTLVQTLRRGVLRVIYTKWKDQTET